MDREIVNHIRIKNLYFCSKTHINPCDVQLHLIESEIKKSKLENLDTLQLEKLKTACELNLDKFFVSLSVKDFDNNYDVTGKVGFLSFFLFKELAEIFASNLEKIGLNNIFGIQILLPRNEERRLRIYNLFATKKPEINSLFLNEYLSESTLDPEYKTYYRWK